MSSKLSYTFGYWWLRGTYNRDSSSTSKTSSKTHYVVATMRIQRYYSSVREELSPLSAGAVELLNRQDYVSFFKACGPTYIRGIRRAQEVDAIFYFQSTSTETASQYASNLQVTSGWWGWGNFKYGSNFQSKSKFSSITKTLKIKIIGYGLGLGEEGSETLIADSLPAYQKVMRFAFDSMTKIPNAHHIGMVYGMEVVPWAENVMFQVEAGINDESIEVPLPRSLIPKAFEIGNPSNTDFTNDQRGNFRCKEPSYEIDRHGYCCEIGALYDYEAEDYDPADPEDRICKPLRVLDKAIVRDNMSNNGEFVARLDRVVRYKMNQLNTLEKCISAARSIPERFDYYILKSMDTVKYDGTIDGVFTLFELKMAIDPFNDFAMVKHMGREIDEFIEMFYMPCLTALFGTNIGTTSDTDPSFFMAYPWHTHDECIHLSCLASNMRWDRREGGGCVPGLISGTTALSYDWNDSACAKDTEYGGEVEKCKYDSEELYNYHAKTTHCWQGTVPAGRIDYFMEHFCMPEITGEKVTEEEAQSLFGAYEDNCVDGIPFSNMPSIEPSAAPTNIHSASPSNVPTEYPSLEPSSIPTTIPSGSPTV